MTPEMRRGMYSLNPDDLVVPFAVGEAPKENEPEKEKKNDKPQLDPEVVEALVGMGFGEDQVRRAIVKFPFDPDNMQRVEFILSGDADVEPAASDAKAADAKDTKSDEPKAAEPKGKERRIPKELQTLFARMQTVDANVAQSTKRLTDCFGAGFSGGVQHDVHELNRLLFDRIEKQLRGLPVQGLINELYRGTMVNRILCKSCGHKSEREEDYLDLSLVVGDFANVEVSLQNSVTDEELTGDNLYQCSGCNQKVEALKGARIRTVPPVLILSLSRFEYDKQTWQRVKNSKSFPFPFELNMAPFMEQQPPKQDLVYDLFGVVIHCGAQAQFGHYHTYLHDVLNESKRVGLPLGEKEESPPFEGWFDFNDTTVKPISKATVETQFGGSANKSECAYMLVYRQRNSPVLMKTTDAVPQPPPHLAAEIEAENAEVQRKRAEWEEMKNKIEIVVHVPTMLERAGDAVRIISDTSKGKEEEEEEDDDEDQSHRLTRPFKVLIDRHQTLGDLKALVRSWFGDLVPDVSKMQMHRIRLIGSDQRLKFLRPLDRPMAPDGTELVFDDSAALDALSTVTHGCDVLAWDGVHLFPGEKFEVAYDVITLCVTFYDDQDKPKKYDVMVREGSLVGDLHSMLSTREQLTDSEELLLFRVDYSRLVDLQPEVNGGKTLREMLLTDHTKVSCEKKRPDDDGTGESRAAIAARSSEETRNVYVTNNCDATAVMEAIKCTMGMTVWDLKSEIVKKIGTLNERMPMRLRRMKAGGGDGSLFPDEGATLRKAGIEDNVRVILEYGEPPDATSITVKYMWGTPAGTKLSGEIQGLCAEVTTELRELKKRIMSALHLESDPATHRLRKTDYWGNQKEIFDDEEKTLKALGFKDCDCVWLEEGSIPPKGMVELQIELQTQAANLGEKPGASASDIWDTVNVATIHAFKTATLAELRKQIREDAVLGGLVGDKSFRVWCKGKLLRGDDKALKRLGIIASCTLSLHVLPAESASGNKDPENLLEANGVLLYLRQRIVATNTFSPPIETVLSAQKRGSQPMVRRAELLKHIASIAGIEEQPLLVAKFVPQSGRWRVVVDPFEEQSIEMEVMKPVAAAPEPAPQGVKALHKKQVERKKADEIFLSDGDLVVWKRVSDDPNNNDDFISYLNRQYGETYVSTGHGSMSRIESGPRNKPKEIGLQISDDGW